MLVIMDRLKKRGQGLVEYVLILTLVSMVTLLVLSSLANRVESTFSKIGSGLAP